MEEIGMKINYQITNVRYCEGIDWHHRGYPIGPRLKSVIEIDLDCFNFPNGTPAFVYNGDDILSGGNSMRLFLDTIRFKQLTGREWDGTKEGVEEHKDLEGMVYSMNLRTDKKVD